MRYLLFVIYLLFAAMVTSCASNPTPQKPTVIANMESPVPPKPNYPSYESRLPSHIDTNGQNVVLIDPNVHAWGAYGPDNNLVRAGLAVAGSNWCPDLGRRCHTKSGTFRVQSLGSPNCKSKIFPIPRGGAPMPYCMFFNAGQAMHGVHENELAEANLSHGCVRMHTPDAEWLRYNFVNVGTKVIVKPY